VHAIILERGRGFGIFFLRDAKWCDLGPFQGILIKLCVLLTMPVASATAEMPFSVNLC
jgi:hypothetical protein